MKYVVTARYRMRPPNPVEKWLINRNTARKNQARLRELRVRPTEIAEIDRVELGAELGRRGLVKEPLGKFYPRLKKNGRMWT